MGAHVTQIPRIMVANGLTTGAQVMRRWFSLDAHSNPETATPQFDLVDMTFVRSFSGPSEAIDDKLVEKIWTTDGAKKEIIRMLHKRGKLRTNGTHQFHFDNISNNNPTAFPQQRWDRVDSDYVTYIVAGSSYYGGIDDFKATLGRAVIRILVAGEVTVEDNIATVTINKVGLYLRDSYDFNDDEDAWFSQVLGYWEAHENYVGTRPMVPSCEMQYESVNLIDGLAGFRTGYSGGWVSVPTGINCYESDRITNWHFRTWRAGSGKGGDFLIFSDIEHHTTNDSFIYASPSAGWGAV